MGGSAQPASTTQTTKTELSPEQKQIFDLAMPYAKQYAETPTQQYAGTGIAGFTNPELAAQQKLLNQSSGAGGALAGQAATAQGVMLDPTKMLDVGNNEYVKGMMAANADVVRRNLMESALPQVVTGATQAGGMYSGGSSREGIAQGQAIGRAATALADANAGTLMDAYKSGLSTMTNAVQNNAGVQAQQLFEPSVMSAVGEQQRSMEQAQLDEQIRKFYTGQSLPFLKAQELMSFLNGMPGATTTSTATGTTPQANPLMTALGGGATGAALGSAIPGIGTGIGAGAGLLAALLSSRR